MSSFPDIDLKNFPSRLRAVRGGEALRSFAARVGVSAPTIQSYERGESSPTVEVVKRIAESTGRSFVWLLSGDVTGSSGAESEEPYDRMRRGDRRRLDKVEDIFRGNDERVKQRIRAVIDLIE